MNETETPYPYVIPSKSREQEDRVIAEAIDLLTKRLKQCEINLDASQNVRNFLRLNLSALEHEVFAVMFLNSRNQLIEYEEVFRGTLTQTSVYPREIVKLALKHNANAVILAHNHPSGSPDASSADELLTRKLKEALNLVDVRVLDHFIVTAHAQPLSFAERGLI